MAIIVFQHSDSGTPGRLGATLRDNGFKLDVRRADLHPVGAPGGIPRDLDDVQGLVILGGPQNVTDIGALPWMQSEAELIRDAHAAELPIIGICLGAQLIAHALGGEVGPRAKPCIGFYPVSLTSGGQTEALLGGVPWESAQVFSCGQEVKKLPPGAQLLAQSKGVGTVIFRAGLRTFASLAHFECDLPMTEALFASGKGELAAAGITESEIKVQTDQLYPGFARVSERLCVNLATLLYPAPARFAAV